jgi:hypothetical protein
MCGMCPDGEPTANILDPKRRTGSTIDEMTQRTADMKLVMNDPEKMREYYEPPRY